MWPTLRDDIASRLLNPVQSTVAVHVAGKTGTVAGGLNCEIDIS